MQKSFLINKFSFNFFLIENFAPIDYKSAKPARQPREMPPYNGFGSEEDSLCNCLSLIPKPPKRDFIKFMDKDRYISHFSLLFETLYVICYHLYNFEQVRKHPQRSATSSTKCNASPWQFFACLKLYKWQQIAQSIAILLGSYSRNLWINVIL